MSITVVNVKTAKSEYHYIGRGTRNGMRSALANPFRLERGAKPGSTLGRYREWLWEAVKREDEAVMSELFEILDEAKGGDVHLGCWCKPGPCHGEIVRSCLEWLDKESTDKMNL